MRGNKWTEKPAQSIHTPPNDHTIKQVRGSRFVCSAYYAFQDDEHLYLVLDLYLGGDLRFHLTKAPQGRMTPQQVSVRDSLT